MSWHLQLMAAWLLITLTALHPVAVSCSNDSVVEKENPWLDEVQRLLLMTRGVLYHGAPPHLRPLTSGTPIGQQCQKDLTQMVKNIKVLDAFGKPGAGLFEGNTQWLGSYDECKSIEGYKYCLADMQLNGTQLGIKGVAIVVRWGICPPANCSEDELITTLKFLLSLLDAKYVQFEAVSAVGMTCPKSPPIPYSAGVICTIVLLCLLGVLMIAGSLYDEYLKFKTKKRPPMGRWLQFSVENDAGMEEDDDDDDELLLGQNTPHTLGGIILARTQPLENGLGKFLLCFAVTRNLSKLLDTRQKDTSIGCLNGIRVISMSWVVLGHALVFSVVYGTSQNFLVFTEWVRNFGFQAVANAFFSVDSFFFLSGFLISYLTLSRMEELKSAKAWAWFYFHRYWRLTPVLGLTILVWMYIQPFIGDSPVWSFTTAKPWCQKYWWTNFLYINNFYPQGFNSQCIGWSWYLANDMQFFIISPLLLVPLYYAPTFGVIALSAVTLICMLVTATIMTVYKASVDIAGVASSAQNGYGLDDNSLVYEKPYCRIAPYLVGIGLGFIMHRIGKRKVNMSPLSAILGWLMATAIAISILYGFYPSYHANKELALAGQVVYGTLSRFGWGLAVAWVVFACKYGYGGWVNRFLSWSGWIPLSRITYATYMFHPIVYIIFFGNFGTPIYESRYLVAYFFTGNLLMSYGVALLVTLAVEYPLANLEKFFMPNNPKEMFERHNKRL